MANIFDDLGLTPHPSQAPVDITRENALTMLNQLVRTLVVLASIATGALIIVVAPRWVAGFLAGVVTGAAGGAVVLRQMVLSGRLKHLLDTEAAPAATSAVNGHSANETSTHPASHPPGESRPTQPPTGSQKEQATP